MTSDKEKFITLKKERGDVSLRDDGTAKIMGKRTVTLKGKAKARNVLNVEGLKHNLLSVGQMCDANLNITFHANSCEIK